MLKVISEFSANTFRKLLPDSFVFAIVLSLLTFLIALISTDTPSAVLPGIWIQGVLDEKIVFFAFTMILILACGYSIGTAPLVQSVLNRILGIVERPWQGYLCITLVSLAMMLINWGLAPLAAVFAMHVCARVAGMDYRIGCAALYSGMIVWHGGLSASAPLMVATETTAASFVEQGLLPGIIPVHQTLLHPVNFALIGASILLLPVLILFLASATTLPASGPGTKRNTRDSSIPGSQTDTPGKNLAEKLNRSRLPGFLLATASTAAGITVALASGFNLRSLAFLMLGAALFLQMRPLHFLASMKEGMSGTVDILLQFPLFGGIMNLFIATGLAATIAETLSQYASGETLPAFAFVISSFINMFIPSGGGEWLVIGPSLLKAASLTGADVGKTIMGFSYGDAITNLINPFWTLAFLPIMNKMFDIRPRDFMGYTFLVCAVFYVVFLCILLI